jgi:Rod binding domain-containing protein
MQISAMALQAHLGGITPQPRLVKAAHEFEAQMMKELLRPMTGMSNLLGEEEEETAAGSGNALSEYSAEALAGALSQQGGFGIADRIVRDLSRDGNPSGNGKVTKKEHGNTVMRVSK